MIATCPRCGDHRVKVFVRSMEELVCRECAELDDAYLLVVAAGLV